MKTKTLIVLFILAILPAFIPASANDRPKFRICQDVIADAGITEYWVYAKSETEMVIGVTEVESPYGAYGLMIPQNTVFPEGETLIYGIALDNTVTSVSVSLVTSDTWSEKISISTDKKYKTCGDPEEQDQTITDEVLLTAEEGTCYTVSLEGEGVSDDNGEIILRGQDDGKAHLIINTQNNQDTNPDDYSLEETPCPIS